MMQIPNLPNYMQVPQPNYNAVKIDVHNPMVNVPAQQAPAQAPQDKQASEITNAITCILLYLLYTILILSLLVDYSK